MVVRFNQNMETSSEDLPQNIITCVEICIDEEFEESEYLEKNLSPIFEDVDTNISKNWMPVSDGGDSDNINLDLMSPTAVNASMVITSPDSLKTTLGVSNDFLKLPAASKKSNAAICRNWRGIKKTKDLPNKCSEKCEFTPQNNYEYDFDIVCDVLSEIVDKTCQDENGEEQKTCSICGTKLPTLPRLKRHLKFHEKKRKIYYCSVCGMDFDQRSHLEYHMPQHSHKKIYSCEICGRWFRHKLSLNGHIKRHTSQPRFNCNTCNRKFWEKSALKYHIEERHNVNKDYPFLCPICGVGFHKLKSLARHKGHHPPYVCKSCKIEFKTRKELSEHRANEHSTCNFCGVNFKNYYVMRAHVKSECKMKPRQNFEGHFCCTVCKREFAREQDLTFHSKEHSLEKYKCKICGNKFSRMHFLKAHMISHSNEKPFKCDICGRKFVSKGCLNTHKHLHFKARKYFSCSICDKKFRLEHNLKKHITSHDKKNTENSQESTRSEKTALRLQRKKRLRSIGSNSTPFNIMNNRFIIGPVKISKDSETCSLFAKQNQHHKNMLELKTGETNEFTAGNTKFQGRRVLPSEGVAQESEASILSDAETEMVSIPHTVESGLSEYPERPIKVQKYEPELPYIMNIKEGESEPYYVRPLDESDDD